MEIDLKVYLNMIRKRLWIVVVTLAIFTLAANYYSNRNYQPVYQASSKIIIAEKASADAFSASQFSFGGMSVDTSMIGTYKEIIKLPLIMDKVVQRHPDLNLTADQLATKISLISIGETQLMAIVATDSSHEKAVRIANSVTEVFQAEVPKLLNLDNIEILTKAKSVPNPKPINEKSSRNIALAAAASVVIGVGIIVVLDFLDDSIRTVKDVKSVFHAPTLAVVPKRRERGLKRLWPFPLRKKGRSGDTYAAKS
ncbi:YveK family protein [Paenibacillus chartarius]|uniref:YveK family protein n=1 Tax=Paenibacillus chartarius TaxID=747481 RepID=A0ABV6DUZ5_9BACL